MGNLRVSASVGSAVPLALLPTIAELPVELPFLYEALLSSEKYNAFAELCVYYSTLLLQSSGQMAALLP